MYLLNFYKWIVFIIYKEYRLIKKQGSGTFSEVYKAQSLKTGAYVAIKCLKSHFTNNDQVINW